MHFYVHTCHSEVLVPQALWLFPSGTQDHLLLLWWPWEHKGHLNLFIYSMFISDTQKSLKSSHYVRASRSLCLGTSDSHFYSSAPMKRNKGPVTLPELPGKVSLASDPCEKMWDLYLQAHISITLLGFALQPPPSPIQGIISGLEWNHPTYSNSLSSELTWASVLEIQNTILCCNIPSLTQTPYWQTMKGIEGSKYNEGGLTS